MKVDVLLELCNNLDKIIEIMNFIKIKIIAFYYRDNSEFHQKQICTLTSGNNHETRYAHT